MISDIRSKSAGYGESVVQTVDQAVALSSCSCACQCFCSGFKREMEFGVTYMSDYGWELLWI